MSEIPKKKLQTSKAETNVNLLQLAKQGNPKAIAALINRQLQTQDITANVDLEDDCLKIVIEAVELPKEKTIVEYFRRSFTSLGAAKIKKVKVYGKRIGQTSYDWDTSFNLVELTSEKVLTPTKNSNTKEQKEINKKEQEEINKELQIRFNEIKTDLSNFILRKILIEMGFIVTSITTSSSKSEGNQTAALASTAFDVGTRLSLVPPSNPVVNTIEGLLFIGAVSLTTNIVGGIARGIAESFKSAKDFYTDGIRFMNSKAYSEALNSFTKAIKKDVQYANAYFQRGNIYFIAGNYTEANKEFNQAISINKNAQFYKKRALVHYALTDYSKAIYDINFAIDADPKDYINYFNRAIVYFTIENYERSFDDLTTAIELNSEDPSSYLMRGNIHISINNNPYAAIQDFNSAVQVEFSREAALGLAVGYYGNKDYNRAIRYYTQVISISIKDFYVLAKIAFKGRCLSYIALNNKLAARVDAYRASLKIKQLKFSIAEIMLFLAIPAILLVIIVFFKGSSKNTGKPVSMYLESNYETLLKYYGGNRIPYV